MSEEEKHCDIEGCDCVYPEHISMYYGWCQSCEEFGICYKQDTEHEMALLYNEGCREHDSGGYSVCVPCALTAYKKKVEEKFVVGEERCICPVCSHDYGALVDLLYKSK